MKVLKTSSAFTLRELARNSEELSRIIGRISSGKILPQDSPTSLALSRTFLSKANALDTISQHMSRTTSILQKYEDVLSQVISLVKDMKTIVERASLSHDPNEFHELESAYIDRLQTLLEIVRSSRIFGRAIAQGGFSNSVIKVENISGQIDFKPTDFDVSGLNFRRFVSEYGRLEVVVRRSGNTFTLDVVVDGVVRSSESKEVFGVDGAPFVVDFEKTGVSVKIPGDGDFEVRAHVKADPVLSVLSEEDEDRFFLPSLEPDFLGIPSDFSDGVEKVLGDIGVAFSKLSEIQGFIGEKISGLKQRVDLDLVLKSKYSILFGQFSDADMPSEAVLLNLKRVLLSSDISSIQRAIAVLSYGVDMLRR